MTFDVTTHPLLSALAVTLKTASAAVFDATAEAAAMVLRITADDLGIVTEAALTEPLRQKGRLAVVRQLNYDLANPSDQKGLSMEKRGERQVAYFAGRYDADKAVDNQARLLAVELRLAVLGDGTTVAADDTEWAVITSLR